MKREVIFPVGPSIAYIPLTRGLFCLVDSFAPDFTFNRLWYASKEHKAFYASGRLFGARMKLHQALCPVEQGECIDHINRNSLDCRTANLRSVTPLVNSRNRAKGSGLRFTKGGWEVYVTAPYRYVGRYRERGLAEMVSRKVNGFC